MTPVPLRTLRCPRRGCGQLAIARDDSQFAVGDYLWQCPAGHHGPRLVVNQRISTAS